MRISRMEGGLLLIIIGTIITVFLFFLPDIKSRHANIVVSADSSKGVRQNETKTETTTHLNNNRSFKNEGQVTAEIFPLKAHDNQTAQNLKKEQVLQKALETEKKLQEWDNLVDNLAAATEVPTAKTLNDVKETFDKLSQKDQVDAIHQAVNLLPDGQFSSLYGILFDKKENSEVLDVIFSDALNRSDDIKIPLMKQLIVDKTHPMFFESARILDATGELDKMSGKTQTDADGTTETTTDN